MFTLKKWIRRVDRQGGVSKGTGRNEKPRRRRQAAAGLEFCQLEPRQMMAINLVADASLAPAHSTPGNFLDVPGVTGGAFVAGLYGQAEIYSVSNSGQLVLHKINQDAGSYPSDLVHFRDSSNVDWVYFSAQSKEAGRELFRLRPGISSSVQMVKDIYPGAGGSNPTELTVLGNKIFFSANAEGNGRELWRTNGTAVGTVLVSDIEPGDTGSDPKHLVAAGNWIHFSAATSSKGREYWKSDGSQTVMVMDINSGAGSSSPGDFVYTNGNVFFAATTRFQGREIWKSDGTMAGTSILKNLASSASSSNPESLTVLGNDVFFTADAGGKGRELYRFIDVLQDTFLVRDIIEGTGSSNPKELTAVGSAIYFTAESPVYGRELWKTFGAAFNTTVVRDIQLGLPGSNPVDLTNVNGTLFFQATLDGDTELWKSNGLGSNTVRVKNINTAGSAIPFNITSLDNKAWFTANDGTHGFELWTSGGTAQTTSMLAEIQPGTRGVQPDGFGNIGTNVLYMASTSEGDQLHVATSNGVITQLTQFDDGLDFANFNGRKSWMFLGNYYFFRFDESGGNSLQLWSSNGTAAGTQMVSEISVAVNSLQWVQVSGAWLYFGIETDVGSVQLWRSNGFSGGTARLREDVTFQSIFRSADVNGRVYFRGQVNGINQLWRSDGTNASTGAVPDITNPSGLLVKGTQVYFSANYATNGLNFIRINGNNAPVIIKAGLRLKSNPGVTIGNTMYFSANDDTAGGGSNYEIWKSDGTTAGTVKLKDINSSGSSDPRKFTNVNGKLFFVASTAASGEELWTSDGTAAGTKQVKEIGPSSSGGQVDMLAVHNNELYFKALDASGWHVWKSNGTAVGTIKLTEFSNVAIYLNQLTANQFLSFNNRLYFTFLHVGYGEELFYYT